MGELREVAARRASKTRYGKGRQGVETVSKHVPVGGVRRPRIGFGIKFAMGSRRPRKGQGKTRQNMSFTRGQGQKKKRTKGGEDGDENGKAWVPPTKS